MLIVLRFYEMMKMLAVSSLADAEIKRSRKNS
jgi:hypothetical protein